MAPDITKLTQLASALRALDPKRAGFTFNMEYAVHEDDDGDLSGDFCLVWFAVCKGIAADEVWSREFEANKQLFERFADDVGLNMSQLESLLYPSFLWHRDEETSLVGIRASDAAHTLDRFIAALAKDSAALADWNWYEDEVLNRKAF